MGIVNRKVSVMGALALSAMVAVPVVNAAPLLWVSDEVGKLGNIDIDSGAVNVVGDMGHTMEDLAFAPDGTLYGLTSDALYRINTDTAETTLVGETGIFASSLVFNTVGDLFAASRTLYNIDSNTGAATEVGAGGYAYSSSGDLAYANNELYLTSTGGDNLVIVDQKTGYGSLITNLRVSGLFGLASIDAGDDMLYGVSGTDVYTINTMLDGEIGLLFGFGGKGLGNVYGADFENVPAAPVPLPAGVWLFASGLVALAGMRRKTKTT